MNIYIKLLFIIGLVFFTSCSTESGSPYTQPSSNTNPSMSFGSNYGIEVESTTTFSQNSADMSIQFGSKTFTFGAFDTQLKPYAANDAQTQRYKEVHRFQKYQDSRGISGIRQAIYTITNSIEYDLVNYRVFAKAEDGNIYITERQVMSSEDSSSTKYEYSQPRLMFKGSVEVGESWVAALEWFPNYDNVVDGVKVTLISDSATAPVSNIEDCIVLFYQSKDFAYYVYLKESIGVVETLWNWEEDANGKVKVLYADAYRVSSTILPGETYMGFGYGEGINNELSGLQGGYLTKRSNGVEASGFYPANNTGRDFCHYEDFASEATESNLLSITSLTFFCDENDETYDFATYADAALVDANTSSFVQQIEVDENGTKYIANTAAGDITIKKITSFTKENSVESFMISGTVVKASDPTVTREITFLLEPVVLKTHNSLHGMEYIVYEADADNYLSASEVGETRRLYWRQFTINDDQTYSHYIYWGEELDVNGDVIMKDNLLTANADSWIWCSDRDANNRCVVGGTYETKRVAEFIVPETSQSEIYIQLVSDTAFGTYRSRVYTMPIVNERITSRSPIARMSTSYSGEEIRGGLDGSGNFTFTASGIQSRDIDGNILTYGWDKGDGIFSIDDTHPTWTFTYTALGDYNLTLTVTDNDGNTDTATKSVVVTDKAEIVFTNLVETDLYTFYWRETGTLTGNNYYIGAQPYLNKGEKYTFKLEGNKTYDLAIEKSNDDGTYSGWYVYGVYLYDGAQWAINTKDLE